MRKQKFDGTKSIATEEPVKGYSLPITFDKLEASGIGITVWDAGIELFLLHTANGIDLQEIYRAIDAKLLSLGISQDKALELAEVACDAIEAHEIKARFIELLK